MATEEEHEIEEEGEEELSLDRLSEAYAEVLRQQSGVEADGEPQSRGELVADKIARAEIEAAEALEEPDPDEEEDSADDNAACPITPESIVEAILFVGVPRGESLTPKRIASVMRDVSPKEVRKIAEKLNEKYEQENSAWRLKVESDSIRMVIAEDLAPLQNEYFGRNREVSLSQSAIDTLAIVAYRQPISKDEIEKASNKSIGGVLNQLVRRDLLTTIPDEKKPRRKLYQTTNRFLDLFQLTELADLPQSHDASEFSEFE